MNTKKLDYCKVNDLNLKAHTKEEIKKMCNRFNKNNNLQFRRIISLLEASDKRLFLKIVRKFVEQKAGIRTAIKLVIQWVCQGKDLPDPEKRIAIVKFIMKNLKMNAYFHSVEEAKRKTLIKCGLNPKEVGLVWNPALHLISPGIIKGINDPQRNRIFPKLARFTLARLTITRVKGQEGYLFKMKNGTPMAMVVEPFRKGFCVWLINLKNGAISRL